MRKFSFTADTTVSEMATAFAARPFDAFGLHAELDFEDSKVREALSLAAQQKPRDAHAAISRSGFAIASEGQKTVLQSIISELCSNPKTVPVIADIVTRQTELSVNDMIQLGKAMERARDLAAKPANDHDLSGTPKPTVEDIAHRGIWFEGALVGVKGNAR